MDGNGSEKIEIRLPESRFNNQSSLIGVPSVSSGEQAVSDQISQPNYLGNPLESKDRGRPPTKNYGGFLEQLNKSSKKRKAEEVVQHGKKKELRMSI